MKKILITGCAGFIGMHLALALKKQNHFVIGYDNFNTYYNSKLKRDRENELKKNDIFIIDADITNQALLEKVLKENNITHLVHLAAQAGVRHSLKCPQDYIHSNITGFVSVLEALRKSPSIKLILASSSSVYGLNKTIPFKESDRTDSVANLYGATKKADEAIAFAYHNLFGIDTIVLRFFTVYGPWGRPDMAYYHFTKNILEDKPIEIFNQGNMKRDFTYIDDIVLGLISGIDKCSGFEIFNLGNNQPVALFDFLNKLETLLGKKANTLMLSDQKTEVLQTFADIEKSKKFLNFHPKTSLEEGLSEFIDWYKKYSQK